MEFHESNGPQKISRSYCVQCAYNQTSQELRMLSSVTLKCQVTKIVMNSGSQLLELKSVYQMSQVLGLSLSKIVRNCQDTKISQNWQIGHNMSKLS